MSTLHLALLVKRALSTPRMGTYEQGVVTEAALVPGLREKSSIFGGLRPAPRFTA